MYLPTTLTLVGCVEERRACSVLVELDSESTLIALGVRVVVEKSL